MGSNLIENQEKFKSLNSLANIKQDSLSDNNHLQSSSSLEFAKQSDSINLTYDKMKMFDDILLQLDGSSSYEQNKTSGLQI